MPIIGVAPQKIQKGISSKTILFSLQIVVGVLGIAILAGGYFLVTYYMNLQKKTDTLYQISLYPEAKKDIPNTNGFLKDQNTSSVINEISQLYTSKVNQYNQIKDYSKNMQQPYENFLQYFFLPPLNIWKDKYTDKIDETLVGQKYLKDNNYLDVNLISQWTDFFKNIGSDSLKNDIKSINVGNINESKDGIFSIPIDVSFSAQTKRSFLLLVDKLSITSNRENISLINNFFFNLWLVLKEKTNASDREIGEKLYNWVFDQNQNSYLSSIDIEKAIWHTANCEEAESRTICYFSFREKMRSIPSLAYTIGIENSNKERELKIFLQNLPPVINVKSFVFQKQTNGSYDGQISLEAYGKSMSESDLSQIATYLGSKCANNLVLSPSVAIAQLDEVIKQTSSISQISNEKSKDLADLRSAFEEINKKYDSLPGFQKAVYLFSIYRMLAENNMCQSTK